MDNSSIFGYVDHTLLKPTSSWTEITKLCKEAIEFNTASVCVPPCYIKRIHTTFPNLNICTVVGFPLGYDSTSAKLADTQKSLEDGAEEVDMVINITDLKNGAFEAVRAEIAALKTIVGSKILKVIVEACYLTEEEKIQVCHAVTNAGADYIKTSTGFGTGGATLEDVKLFKQHIGPNVKIKAAGGIRTRDDMIAFIEAGCSRLGTSSAVSILTQGLSKGY